MAQVFMTKEEVVPRGTSAQVQPFLDEVVRRSRGRATPRLSRTRDGSLRGRYKPTLLAPRVSVFVSAEAAHRDGEDALVVRWWAQIRSLPGGAALEGDVVNGSGARYAVDGCAGERNQEVLAELEREVIRPAIDAVRASLSSSP